MTATSHGPAHRRAMGLAAAVAGMLGAMGLTGCGIQASGVKVVGAAPSLQAANDVTGTDAGSGENQYELYFFHDGKLVPVTRYTAQPITQELLLTTLVKGPDATDTADGFTSVIPAGLSVVSYTALDQQWNYAYSQPLNMAERAQIVCTIQANLNAPSVGIVAGKDENWNICFDFSQDYGAPYLPNLGSASASATATAAGATD